MKKILFFLIIIFFPTLTQSQIIEFDKCHFKFNHSDDKPGTWQDLSWNLDDIIYSANLTSGRLTHITVWNKDTTQTNEFGEKLTRETLFYDIVSVTKSTIIARSYYINNSMLRELMINPNDNSAVHREIIMDIRNKKISEITNPGGSIVFDRDVFVRMGIEPTWKNMQKEITRTHICNYGDISTKNSNDKKSNTINKKSNSGIKELLKKLY